MELPRTFRLRLFHKISALTIAASILGAALWAESQKPLFRMRGLCLGMSRSEVHRMLGAPQNSSQSSEKYLDLAIQYDNDKVESLSGKELQYNDKVFHDTASALDWLASSNTNQSPVRGFYKFDDAIRHTSTRVSGPFNRVEISRIRVSRSTASEY